MAAWAEGLVSAQTALKEGKLFDGVQAINACMEAGRCPGENGKKPWSPNDVGHMGGQVQINYCI